MRLSTRLAAVLLALCPLLPFARPASAQTAIDRSGLETERPAMRTLLEKTIFKVDVAWLDIWFGPAVARRLRELGSSELDARADSIAAVALRATDVLARLEFERDVGFDRFIDGLRSNARKARDAGLIDDATFQSILSAGPRWYAAIADRGVRDGDVMFHRIRGDTLRTVMHSADGQTLIDQTDVGSERRLAALGGYLAPGSDFRDGLIESVVQAQEAARR